MSFMGINQINSLLKAEFGDPHQYLGMHEIKVGDKNKLVVRELIPGAVGIEIVDKKDGKRLAVVSTHFWWKDTKK